MNNQTQNNLLNLVKRNYDEIATDFSETRKRNPMPLWGELVKYVQFVEDGEVVLDAGCGNGRILKAFGNKKIKYLGVDQNEKLLEKARELYPDREFIQGDILELGKIPQINFDYVFCVAALHHIPGKKLRIDVLRQLKNKIKPDGEILITVWNMWPHVKFCKLVFKFFLLKIIKKNNMDFGDILFDWNNSVKRYYHVFTKRELKDICKKAGLNIKKIYKDEYNYYLILSKQGKNT
ncbi:MAG: class I SAM-dependent methyltransferase [bacterium]